MIRIYIAGPLFNAHERNYLESGYGREKGREALWNYVQTKNVAIKLQG